MELNKKMLLLYIVTDRSRLKDGQTLSSVCEDVLANGATCIQLREKKLNEEDFFNEAMEIAALCKRYGVPFFINDNVEIAIKCHADGVHVGQKDMQLEKVRQIVGDDMIIGVSVHSVEEALKAVENGANYLGVGAVFSTFTKTDTNVLPAETLRDICAAVDVPVVAIGGINEKNLMKLSDSGVDGVAVVSAVFAAENPGEATARLLGLARKTVAQE